MIPELGPKEIENIHESQKLSEYYMENIRQEVYIVIASGLTDMEPFSDILGVYKNLEDAKENMSEDIKEQLGDINPDDPERWEIFSDDGLHYENSYSYSVCIEKWEVK